MPARGGGKKLSFVDQNGSGLSSLAMMTVERRRSGSQSPNLQGSPRLEASGLRQGRHISPHTGRWKDLGE